MTTKRHGGRHLRDAGLRVSVRVLATIAIVGAVLTAGDARALGGDARALGGDARDRFGPSDHDWIETGITFSLQPTAATLEARAAEASVALQPGTPYDDEYFAAGYFNLKLGPHEFTDENDDSNTAFWSEAIFGYSLGDYFALEAGLGYLAGNGSGAVDFDYYAFPFLFGGRVFAPLGPVELHAGANLAMYVFKVRAESDFDGSREHDNSVLFGGGVSAGVNFDVGRGGFLGAEVKYTNTGQTTLEGRSYDLDGVAVMFVSGIRF